MAGDEIRLSGQTLIVLRLFLSRPQKALSGAMITRDSSVGSGTLYPMLARLEAAGWLTSEWEQVDPKEAARPRQRFYRLTGKGVSNTSAALSLLSYPSGELSWSS